jgi:drug/metabolite transporter (DMT)-like permease
VNRQEAAGAPGWRPGAGEASVLASATLYGVATTLSVAALHVLRPADLLAVELGMGALVLLAAAAWTRRLRWRAAPRQLLLGALLPGADFLFADLGLARTSASSGSLLLAAEPVLAAALAVAFLRERLRLRTAVALAGGLLGGALVALSPAAGHAATPAGHLLVLAAVLAAATFIVATRRYSDGEDGLAASAWQAAGGALAAAPFVAASWAAGGSRLEAAGALTLAAAAGVVACVMAAAVAFNHGIARMPASRAGQLLGFTPVAGTLSAVLLLGERPAPLQLAGGAAILVSLVIVLRTGVAGPAPQPAADPVSHPRPHQSPLAQSRSAPSIAEEIRNHD